MRIAFGVNHLFFLRSHRFAIVQEACARGWETHILTGPRSDPRDEPAAAERAHAEALVLALETLGPRHPVTVQARLQLASAREARMSAVERR